MLVATWVLAIATSILALSGPVALFAWLSARRADRDRRERDRQGEAADRVLASARTEFLSKNTAAVAIVLSVIAAMLGWSTWSERKNGGSKP